MMMNEMMNNSAPTGMNYTPYDDSEDVSMEIFDPIDCDILEYLGQGDFPSGTHNGRGGNNSKKTTRVPSIKKEKTMQSSPRHSSPRRSTGLPSKNAFENESATLDSNGFRYGGASDQDFHQYAHNNPDSCASSEDMVDDDYPTSYTSLDDLKSNQLEASKDRRRERNKVLARKTRCKKKAEFEYLRKQLLVLQGENDRLKDMVKGR